MGYNTKPKIEGYGSLVVISTTIAVAKKSTQLGSAGWRTWFGEFSRYKEVGAAALNEFAGPEHCRKGVVTKGQTM